MSLALGRRQSLSGSVRESENRLREFRVRGGYLEDPNNVWWNGVDNTRGTLVQPSGSQTITEDYYEKTLRVSSITSIAAADLTCLLFPVALSIGDIWSCQIFVNTSSTNQLLLGGIVMANGTTTSSAVVGAFSQMNNDGNWYSSSRQGTPNALTSEVGGLNVSLAQRSPFLFHLHYSAANTFVGAVTVPGGLNFRSFGNLTSTQTPTHVGIGWTNWGTSPVAPVIEFGPLVKVQ